MTTPSSAGSAGHYPARSNPNLARVAMQTGNSGNGILARCSSQPPEMFCWDDPEPPGGPPCLASFKDSSTQTDTDTLMQQYVTQNRRKVLAMLGLDPDKVGGMAKHRGEFRRSRTFSSESEKGEQVGEARSGSDWRRADGDVLVDMGEEGEATWPPQNFARLRPRRNEEERRTGCEDGGAKQIN